MKQTVYSHYVTATGENLSNSWIFIKTNGDSELKGERTDNPNETVRWSDSMNLIETSRSANFEYRLESITRHTQLIQSGARLEINMVFNPSISTVNAAGQSGTISFTSNLLTTDEIKDLFRDTLLEIVQTTAFVDIDINTDSYTISENTSSSARSTNVILRHYPSVTHVGHTDLCIVSCLQYGTPAPVEDTILIANDLNDYSSSFKIGVTDAAYVAPSETVTVTKGNSKQLKYDSTKYVGFYLENGLTVNAKLRDRDAGKDLTGSAKTYGQNAWVYYKMSDMLEWSTKTSGILANIGLTNQ